MMVEAFPETLSGSRKLLLGKSLSGGGAPGYGIKPRRDNSRTV